MHLRAWIAGLILAVIVSSCSSSFTSPTGTTLAAQLSGSWSEQGLVAGSTFTFQLSANGATISGTGRYGLEAGSSGALSVSGAVTGSTIQITFAYDTGRQTQFTGTLTDANTMSGTTQDVSGGTTGGSTAVVFHRT